MGLVGYEVGYFLTCFEGFLLSVSEMSSSKVVLCKTTEHVAFSVYSMWIYNISWNPCKNEIFTSQNGLKCKETTSESIS